jgi:tetratricopeptide (TPR) repeat protein
LAGLAFIFLLPARNSMAHIPGFGFWDAFRMVLRTDKIIPASFPRILLLALSITSLIPIFVIGIRWASYFGDTSPVGIFFTTSIFHIFHAVFFLACIWVAFDPPFSPRQKAFDLPLLQVYYLGALSIGYFAGYFLLIFGTQPPKSRNRPHPVLQFINYAVVAGVWVLAVTVPTFLTWKNLTQLHNSHAADAAFARLTSLTARSLPSQPAVVLSDDRTSLLLLRNNLSHRGKSDNYLFLDTSLLGVDPAYIDRVTKNRPDFIDPHDLPRSGVMLSTLEVMHFLELLGKKHDIYYLQPSFGPFFERFYLQPDGLAYQFKPYDTNVWKAPPLTPQQIQNNTKAWDNITANELPVVTNMFDISRRPITPSFLAHLMDSGHLTIESNKTILIVGTYYSRSLNYWGVELQRANLLGEAGKCFENALRFNPENLAARVNSQLNQALRAGKKITVDPPAVVHEKFGKFGNWVDLLRSDGPSDDPSFCYALGETFAGGENYREGDPLFGGPANYLQAIQQFHRVLALAPDCSNASYWLCKLFLHIKKNPEALEAANHVLEMDPDNTSALFYQAVAYMQLGSYDKAVQSLNHVLTKEGENRYALLERAISQLQLHNYDAAKADYEKLAKAFPKAYQVYYGLQEVAYQQKDTNAVIKNIELYLTNYYQAFPTNVTPVETDEVKSIKQRLKEFKNGAP